MSRTLRIVLIVLGSLALAGVLLLAALIAYVVTGDNKAKAKAKSLCESAVVGASAEGVLDRAVKSSSATSDPRWRKLDDGTEELRVVFPAAIPLTGYLCSISAKDGVVTAAVISTVD